MNRLTTPKTKIALPFQFCSGYFVIKKNVSDDFYEGIIPDSLFTATSFKLAGVVFIILQKYWLNESHTVTYFEKGITMNIARSSTN